MAGITSERIPVVDLFAGPGGLGEGFAAYRTPSGEAAYKIALSVEKDAIAHSTLELRSFFRQFSAGQVPRDYYAHLQDPVTLPRCELFARHRAEAERARKEAWHAELGSVSEAELDRRVKDAIGLAPHWLLIGGPPCQAYSIVGRARRGGMDALDPRVHLYREYLRILAVHKPAVFIMENVKGLLSAKLDNSSVFDRMLDDLSYPTSTINRRYRSHGGRVEYQILSLVPRSENLFARETRDPRDFIIHCEHFGIPQARHRVILLGVRSDVNIISNCVLRRASEVSVRTVIGKLPRLRSGLSKQADSKVAWKEAIAALGNSRWLRELRQRHDSALVKVLNNRLDSLVAPHANRGAEFLPAEPACDYRSDWYIDSKLSGICNHSSRGHMVEDLHRYFFSSAFAEEFGRSPTLKDFPPSLLPSHASVAKALDMGHFADRFRVQVGNRPATTVTSHIAKDGHYYIHYDPTQCRSLTVREAARLQTFPDNYLFCGNRTQQYHQVGNAVPPLLACQIAEAIHPLLKG